MSLNRLCLIILDQQFVENHICKAIPISPSASWKKEETADDIDAQEASTADMETTMVDEDTIVMDTHREIVENILFKQYLYHQGPPGKKKRLEMISTLKRLPLLIWKLPWWMRTLL